MSNGRRKIGKVAVLTAVLRKEDRKSMEKRGNYNTENGHQFCKIKFTFYGKAKKIQT